MQHETLPDEPAAVHRDDVAADPLLDLFMGLLDAFPNGVFVCKSMIRLVGVVARHLPAHRRIAVVQALLDEAVELGVKWH